MTTDRPEAIFDPDQAPFGDNRASKSLLPGQFNYVMLYEGTGTAADPIPTLNPTVRLQVGPDIDQSGAVINNTMKPYPTAVADDPTSLPGGADSFAAPGVIELDLTGLTKLSSSSYAVWLFNRAGGGYTLAEGSVVTVDGDSTPDFSSAISIRGVPVFLGRQSARLHRLRRRRSKTTRAIMPAGIA